MSETEPPGEGKRIKLMTQLAGACCDEQISPRVAILHTWQANEQLVGGEYWPAQLWYLRILGQIHTIEN